MDTISHGAIAGVSQSCRFCFTINTTLANDLMITLYFYFIYMFFGSGDQVRSAGHVARLGKRRGAYRALVGRPDGKRPLGRSDRRSENDIEVEFQEVGWGHGLDSSGSGCR